MHHLCKFALFSKLCEKNGKAEKAHKWAGKFLHEVEGDVADFNEHVATYGLSYGTSEEYRFRMAEYLKKDLIYKEINANQSSYEVGHNQFSTWTDEEYKRILGFKPLFKQDPA